MDNENTTDEQNQSIPKETYPAKLRSKERSHSEASPNNTDINDPENLDYEDIDDNHSVKKIHDEVKSSMDEDGEVSNNPTEMDHAAPSSSLVPNNPEAASDEGEVDEQDLEDGEIHDPSTSKNKNSSLDDQSDRNRNNTGVSSPQAKIHCRYFSQGRCHWGPNCKYIHPNNDSTRNSIGASIDNISSTNNDISPPTSAGISMPQTTKPWISPQATTATPQFFPGPHLRGPAPPPNIPLGPSTGTESAWERGLRSAKTLREQSMRRKQQDKDFNDKRFNLTIRDALDEKEIDDNVLNIDRPSSVDYDLNDFPDQRAYPDRYHSYRYSDPSNNSHYNNHQRMNNSSRHNNTSSNNDHPDRRPRHSDDYNDNRNRKDKSSIKDSKTTSKRDDSSSYKRNSSQQQYTSGSHHHNNDEQLHLNNYGSRRGDDWHDPWDRSRNQSSSNRRSSGGGGGGGGGRGPSYSSSSGSSSSSRSTRSRSHSTSSSSRSRSRSRSRPKRRSPSVTRATATSKSSSETTKNGNDKKSNGNKKLVSPSSTTNKFLPGRQISSHTLKKAEKSSNSTKSTTNSHSKDQRGKDSDISRKKQTKKENTSRPDSTSSSSSSDSDTNRVKNRSSSSSSDSSSSENETRTKTKLSSIGKSSADGQKSVSRQLSSSSGTGGKKSKNETLSQRSSKSKESSSTSAKKRRDTSSSTGSTSTTKKTKLNTDSHKSSTDASNAENSDSSKKKEKQNILKKLQEVEKLINQRSTKTSS